MTDIVIFRRMNVCTMFAESTPGQRWMQDNLILDGPAFSFSAELIEDFVKELGEADLSVEVK